MTFFEISLEIPVFWCTVGQATPNSGMEIHPTPQYVQASNSGERWYVGDWDHSADSLHSYTFYIIPAQQASQDSKLQSV